MKRKKPTLDDLMAKIERLRAAYKKIRYSEVAEMLVDDYSLEEIADQLELPVERIREIGWELVENGEFDDLVDNLDV